MGGQSRRDMKSGKLFERTHLVESRTDSVNYRVTYPHQLIDNIWKIFFSLYSTACLDLWNSYHL